MCAMLTTVVAGKPVMFTWKFATAAVIALAASRVMTKSIAAVPLPTDSPLVIGGVSCEGDSVAVNRVVVVPAPVVDVDGELELEQPAARRTETSAIERRGMCSDSLPDQKNLRVRLKPRNSESGSPPAPVCANVESSLLLKLSWKTCAPARFSIAKPYSAVLDA